MTNGDVDDSENAQAISVKVYRPKAFVFAAYDTHAMRGADAIDHYPQFEAYQLTLSERLRLLFLRQERRKAFLDARITQTPLNQQKSAPLLLESPRIRKLAYVRRDTQALVSMFGTSAPSVAALRAVRSTG